jgi:hypothetical protein
MGAAWTEECAAPAAGRAPALGACPGALPCRHPCPAASPTHPRCPLLLPLLQEDNHELEAALGFPLFTDGPDRLGWLMNLNAVSGGVEPAGAAPYHAVLRRDSTRVVKAYVGWRGPRAAEPPAMSLPSAGARRPRPPATPAVSAGGQGVWADGQLRQLLLHVPGAHSDGVCVSVPVQAGPEQAGPMQAGSMQAGRRGRGRLPLGATRMPPRPWPVPAALPCWLVCPTSNCVLRVQDGAMFKAQVEFAPYFYIQVKARPGARGEGVRRGGAAARLLLRATAARPRPCARRHFVPSGPPRAQPAPHPRLHHPPTPVLSGGVPLRGGCVPATQVWRRHQGRGECRARGPGAAQPPVGAAAPPAAPLLLEPGPAHAGGTQRAVPCCALLQCSLLFWRQH